MTAELKEGKYVYYHCTGNAGPCAKPAIRQEKLKELLAEVVGAISIDATQVQWLKLALRDGHRDEEAYHRDQLAELKNQYDALQTKLDRAYDDKIDGKITETFWSRKSAEWRDAQLRALAAMETHQRANGLYFEEGFRILELAGKARDLWLGQPAEGKRKLLNLVQSNCTFDGVSLTATYKKTFCWLAEGSVCDNWLPSTDNWRNLLMRFTFALIGLTPPETPPAVSEPPTSPRRRRSKESAFLPLAFEFKRLLDSGEVKNKAEIARRYRLSRARVSQVMALFNLPSSVIEEISAMMYDEKAQVRERHLRQLRALPPDEQGEALLGIIRGRGSNRAGRGTSFQTIP